MKTRTLTLHNDPSHGWLEVKRADLITLEIEDQISRFSYEKGSKVYLEEDNDLMTYLRAASAAGWHVEIKDIISSNDSFIRLLNGYQSTAAARQSIAAFYDNNPNLTLADLSRFTGKSVPALKQFLLERK